ncbi:MAG TPA: hypothetical protein VFA59_20380 [Vicinamibacterales bacterium]|nr:hypothetical protein [Vicinamibacterales bacterium]
MTDEDLRLLLRSVQPPIDDRTPTRDLWPRVMERIDGGPTVSAVDVGMAALVAIVLAAYPKLLWLLAYHL